MKKVDIIVLGAGSRGGTYAKYATIAPDKMQVVAVAEPLEERREAFRRTYSIPQENAVDDWKSLLDRPKFADAVVISTQDRLHFAPAMAAIEKGYHLLLEKPMATSPYECLKIAQAAEEKGVHVIICHVLRYAPFFYKMKELIDSGVIGDVMNIDHTEGIGNIHFSHSYTRGNWHIESESAPSLLAKSCHDIDMLQWLVDKKLKRIQSFGKLSYFTKANKPSGAPKRCIDGCPYGDECVYNAVKLYYDNKENAWFRSAATRAVKGSCSTDERVREALRNTPYGYCVFDSDNDVVDHQTVNMEFENGVIATFTMSAFNRGGRKISVMGTQGELWGNMGSCEIHTYTFKDGKETVIKCNDGNADESILGGHGGGDMRIIMALCELLGKGSTSISYCPARTSAMNHLAVFAAEESRKTGTVIDLEQYAESFM